MEKLFKNLVFFTVVILVVGIIIVLGILIFSSQLKSQKEKLSQIPKENVSVRDVSIKKRKVVLEISKKGISPSEFSVKSNEKILLKVVNMEGVWCCAFESPLDWINGCFEEVGKTQIFEFKTPEKERSYSFKCVNLKNPKLKLITIMQVSSSD